MFPKIGKREAVEPKQKFLRNMAPAEYYYSSGTWRSSGTWTAAKHSSSGTWLQRNMAPAEHGSSGTWLQRYMAPAEHGSSGTWLQRNMAPAGGIDISKAVD